MKVLFFYARIPYCGNGYFTLLMKVAWYGVRDDICNHP